MTLSDLPALLPIIIVAVAAILVMLAAAFCRSHALATVLTAVALAAALISLDVADRLSPRQITALMIVDAYAVFFMGLICAASLSVTLLAHDYLKRRSQRPEEFYVLLLLATVGSLTLVCSNHFASFFLGLEILSVALYALVAYERTSLVGIEAGLKYLVLAATSAAFLLFGMAIIYADHGTLSFVSMTWTQSNPSVIALAGLALMIVGIGFKLALVPFHFWTPDVYQGAPAPVAAFIATVSKGAVLAVLLRLSRSLNPDPANPVLLVFATVAVASMFTGNLLALLQSNVKRMLAYSSIAHLGYLLVALIASGPLAGDAVAYYLTAYFITMLGAFGVVAVLSGADRDAEELADYQGLAWRQPWPAAVMTVMLLSLAGIPLTAGFIGKFYVLAAGAASHLWWLIVVLVVNSAIGLFYYLRVLIAMFTPTTHNAPTGGASSQRAWPTPLASLVLAVLTVSVVWLGIDPMSWIRVIADIVPGAH